MIHYYDLHRPFARFALQSELLLERGGDGGTGGRVGRGLTLFLDGAAGGDGVDLFREVHRRLLAVILDIAMPVMGGEEALDHLRAINPRVPVILSSGFDEIEATRRFGGKGLAGFIQKPYRARALAAKLKQVREAVNRT